MANLGSVDVNVTFTFNETNQVQQALKFYLAQKTRPAAVNSLTVKERGSARNALEKINASSCRGA